MSGEKKKEKKENWLWPDVSTLEGARAAAMGGATVAAIVAAVTLALALYAMYKEPVLNVTAWSLVDVALFVVIGISIWRWVSRTAAVSGLLLYLLEVGSQFASGGSRSPVMALFFILFLVNGVRGAFSYHRLAKAESAEADAAT